MGRLNRSFGGKGDKRCPVCMTESSSRGRAHAPKARIYVLGLMVTVVLCTSGLGCQANEKDRLTAMWLDRCRLRPGFNEAPSAVTPMPLGESGERAELGDLVIRLPQDIEVLDEADTNTVRAREGWKWADLVCRDVPDGLTVGLHFRSQASLIEEPPEGFAIHVESYFGNVGEFLADYGSDLELFRAIYGAYTTDLEKTRGKDGRRLMALLYLKSAMAVPVTYCEADLVKGFISVRARPETRTVVLTEMFDRAGRFRGALQVDFSEVRDKEEATRLISGLLANARFKAADSEMD